MNELLFDYIGLPKEEDGGLLIEGRGWLNGLDENCFEQWFDNGSHIQTYVSFIIDTLICTEKKDEKYALLCSMIRNVKMANQKAYENKLSLLSKEHVDLVNSILFADSQDLVSDDEDEDVSFRKRNDQDEQQDFGISSQKRKFEQDEEEDKENRLEEMQGIDYSRKRKLEEESILFSSCQKRKI